MLARAGAAGVPFFYTSEWARYKLGYPGGLVLAQREITGTHRGTASHAATCMRLTALI